MSVLLVQMPFFTVDTPSISLSLLQASLQRSGIDCEVEYLNLRFARRLGLELYSWIAGDAPPYLLFGDLIFTPALHGTEPDVDRLRALIEPLGTPGVPQVPEELVAAYPDLAQVAIDFVDEMTRDIPWGEHDLVGFATMFQIAPALALARRVHELPGAPPIVLGGSYCESDMGEQLVRSIPWIDYVARGESERLIVDLAHHVTGHGPAIEAIDGLVWRDGDVVRCNGATGTLAPAAEHQPSPLGTAPVVLRRRPDGVEQAVTYELDLLPTPDYHDWIDRALATGLLPRERLRLPIETSRGCWWGEKHHCTFCGLNGGTIAYRRKSPERALQDFDDLFTYGVGMVHAVDDILDFKYFATLLPELKARRHGVEIFYEVKANMTFERVQALHDAGIVWIQPGIESLSSPLLEVMDKGITSWRNVRLLRYAAELEMGVAWNLLYGFPHEDPRWFADVVPLTEALSHLQPPYIECCQVRIHRFSPLYRDRETNGLASVRPTPSYAEIFPFDDEAVGRLAYYFTHEYVDGRDPNDYIQPLADGVKRWHAEVGRAAFLSVARGDRLVLLDTRATATCSRAELDGLDRAVFDACDHAASLDEIVRVVDGDVHDIRRALDRFQERRWVVALDDRFLALAVHADRYVPPHVPLALVEDNLVRNYTTRMARTHQGFVEKVPDLTTLRETVRRGSPVPA